CRGSQAAVTTREPRPSASYSSSTSRPGSGASLPISSTPRPPISIAALERSAGYSWRSRGRRSHCRHEQIGDDRMKRERESAVGRRDFLRTLGAGATLAAAAAGPLAQTAQADTESSDEKRKSRYRETEHVKTFYRVNRYPG